MPKAPAFQTSYDIMADPRNSAKSGRIPETTKKANEQRERLLAISKAAEARPPKPYFSSYNAYWDDDKEEPEAEPMPSVSTSAVSSRSVNPFSSPRIYPHPSGHMMDEWENDKYLSELKEAESEKRDGREREGQDRELKRDEMQYRTALRTAFEIGFKAGLMQRVEVPPCQACERRKERNRIAAQASRLEKRRLDKSSAGSELELLNDIRRIVKRRLPTAGLPPPTFLQQVAPSFSNVADPHFVKDTRQTEREAEDARREELEKIVAEAEEEEEEEIEPPPF